MKYKTFKECFHEAIEIFLLETIGTIELPPEDEDKLIDKNFDKINKIAQDLYERSNNL